MKILIIGAGPTGLSTALEFARHGLKPKLSVMQHVNALHGPLIWKLTAGDRKVRPPGLRFFICILLWLNALAVVALFGFGVRLAAGREEQEQGIR